MVPLVCGRLHKYTIMVAFFHSHSVATAENCSLPEHRKIYFRIILFFFPSSFFFPLLSFKVRYLFWRPRAEVERGKLAEWNQFGKDENEDNSQSRNNHRKCLGKGTGADPDDHFWEGGSSRRSGHFLLSPTPQMFPFFWILGDFLISPPPCESAPEGSGVWDVTSFTEK